MPRILSEKIKGALQWAAPFSGVCFRNVFPEFADKKNILSAQGSFRAGGRFNFKGKFQVLYLSCDLHTCMEETTKSAQQPEMEVAMILPRTVIGIEVKLGRVLDLTDGGIRRKLSTSKNNLLSTDWEECQNFYKQEAFTQQIGRLAREAGFEASSFRPRLRAAKTLTFFRIACWRDHI